MIPLLPLAVGAAIAGIGFAVGKKLADDVLIPFSTDTANGLRQRWGKSAEARRKRRLDEIDPGPKKKASKK